LASSTAGLTLLDSTAGDGDVLNVTALTAAALTTASMGTFTNNIETVNMNLLIGGGNFSATANMPGTTTFGHTGTGAQTITALPAATTIKFDAASTNAITGTLSTSGAFSVALNGSGAAPASVTAVPTFPTLSMTNGTTSTITVTGTSYLGQSASGSLFGSSASSATITGSGNLTISADATTLGAQVGGVSTTGYTGQLTLRPTGSSASFDLSGAGADTTKFTGVRTIDLSQTSGNTIVLASDNGAWPVTVTSNANFGNLSVTQAGSGLTDSLVISATATAGTQTFGTISAPGIETLTVNLQGLTTTASKTVTSIAMDINAGTQALTVTSNAISTNLGTVTADSLNTTGVVGTLTASLGANTLVAGATFTGNTTQPSYITTGGYADIITTGSANDAIYVPANSTNSSAVLNGGLGNDTYSLASTNSAGTVITDAGGTDTLVLTGASAIISGMNNGGTLDSMGINVLVTNGSGVVQVASNQIGSQTINVTAATTQTPQFTLAGTGTLNVSGATLTAAAVGELTATGGAATQTLAVTAFALNGSAGADSIVGSAVTDTILGLAGNDTITGGAGADTIGGGAGKDIIYAAASSGTLTSSDVDVISLVFGDTETYTSAATTVAVTQADVIYGLSAGDRIFLSSSGTMTYTALTATAVANSFISTVVYTAAQSAVAENSAFFGRGDYNATNGSFTWNTSGADTLFAYDSASANSAITAVAIVIVGYAITSGVTLSVATAGMTITTS